MKEIFRKKSTKRLLIIMFIIFIGMIMNSMKAEAVTIGLGHSWNGLWHYTMNGYTDMNLFCAQKGGPLKRFIFIYH